MAKRLFRAKDAHRTFYRVMRIKSHYSLAIRGRAWLCRPRSSDAYVFGQIFVGREYRCLDEVPEPALIIDCGANVGYSTVYFLNRFPKSHVIAVEPDPANFKLLLENTMAYPGRVTAVCSGVWSHETGLVMNDQIFGDGREWARTVRPSQYDEKPDFVAADIGSLLAKSDFPRISILKMDIEGAEAVVFASNYEAWIKRVDNIVIELHGEECERIFRRAVEHEGFIFDRCDELTVCTRPTRALEAAS